MSTEDVALIEHARKQAAAVVACLDSLSLLWSVVACPDPAAHAAQPDALDEDVLAQILDGYRLNRSEYFAPVVAADNSRLETTREWAHRIAAAYAERVTKGSSPDSEQVDSEP